MRAGVLAAILVASAAPPAQATAAAAGAPPCGETCRASKEPEAAEGVSDDASLLQRHLLSMGVNRSSAPQPCLCTFDVDRTLTARQGSSTVKSCQDVGQPDLENFKDIYDTAFGGGSLTLGDVGLSIKGTFCDNCYVGIVTAGDASGRGSKEREKVKWLLSEGGKVIKQRNGKLPDFSGPRAFGGKAEDCFKPTVMSTITSVFVAGCTDGTKQFGVLRILDVLAKQHVYIPRQNAFHFDDVAENIEGFRKFNAGLRRRRNDGALNARQIACSPRRRRPGQQSIGFCGARKHQIQDVRGTHFCDNYGYGLRRRHELSAASDGSEAADEASEKA